MSILSLNNISKKYFSRDNFAVRNIDLTVESGEIIALVGESGSGKTTLLRLIAGFEIPNTGQMLIRNQVMFDGKKFIPPEKRGVGMVFQDAGLFPHLSVSDNIGYGINGGNRSTKNKRIQELLDLVGLSDFEQRFPHELSGGQKQRIALARALAPKPSLVLLDVPFSSLDRNLKDQVRDDIKQIINQTNTTAIFVTHDTKDALSIADRVALIKEGRLRQIDTPEVIYAKPICCCVASFFGKANLVEAKITNKGYDTPLGFIESEFPHSGKNKVILSIRPEHFDIIPTSEPGICASVDKVTFCGDHQEVLLSVLNTPVANQNLQISVSLDTKLKKNQRIHVKPDVQKIQILNEWKTVTNSFLSK